MARYYAAVEDDPYMARSVLRVAKYEGDARRLLGELAWGESVPDNQFTPLEDSGVRLPEHEMKAFLQVIMDAAWQYGLRPSASPDIGELSATKRHLEDMRQLTQFLVIEKGRGV